MFRSENIDSETLKSEPILHIVVCNAQIYSWKPINLQKTIEKNTE